jgi:UDP-N-acetylmuramate--alanine ligase
MMTPRAADGFSDLDLRELPRTGHVHFIGVAGAGMSALAELLVRAGVTVTGCDLRPGGVGTALGAHDVQVYEGHDPAHVADAVAVVVTAAVRPDHEEIAAARARGIPVLKRAQALAAIVNRGTVIAIAGTHGKTTTTAAATAILAEAGLDPTGLVGGRVLGWGSGLRAGGGLFVVEADEYDRSFHTLRPDAAVVTSVEADHLDIYGDVAAVEEAFVEFLALVRPGGLIAACGDDAGARRVASEVPDLTSSSVLLYGTGDDADLRAVNVRQDGRVMTFDVLERGERLGPLTLPTPGVHNVRNALGALAVARHAGATFTDAQTALGAFTGVARRFEELGSARSITVVDDYAHHPTEIAATLAAARRMYEGRRIIAAFQPHLYSRTRDLAAEFGRALAAADIVWVTDVYAAREAPIAGVSGELVANAARAAGATAVAYVATLEQLRGARLARLQVDDVLVAMGAGDIDEMVRALVVTLRTGLDA